MYKNSVLTFFKFLLHCHNSIAQNKWFVKGFADVCSIYLSIACVVKLK